MASYRSTLLFAFRSDKSNNFLTFSKVFCFGKSNFLIKKELGYVDTLKNWFDILETSSRRRKNPHSNLASDHHGGPNNIHLFVEPWICKRRGSSVFRFSSGPSGSSPLVAPAVVLTTGLGCMGISSDTVHLPGQDSETLYQRSSLTMATLSRTCNLAFFSFLSFFFFSFSLLELQSWPKLLGHLAFFWKHCQ